jgi:hypothetical protein
MDFLWPAVDYSSGIMDLSQSELHAFGLVCFGLVWFGFVDVVWEVGRGAGAWNADRTIQCFSCFPDHRPFSATALYLL